jgi:hypothetical protein
VTSNTPPPPPPSTRHHQETLELINAEITAALGRASDASSRIDNKAVVLVGYAAAAASFLATRHPQPLLAALAYTAYAAAAALGTWAYAVQTYTDVPEPLALFNVYWNKPPADTLAALAATRAQAFHANTRPRKRKKQRWWASLASLAAGTILMILALTIPHTGHHDSAAPVGTRQAALTGHLRR